MQGGPSGGGIDGVHRLVCAKRKQQPLVKSYLLARSAFQQLERRHGPKRATARARQDERNPALRARVAWLRGHADDLGAAAGTIGTQRRRTRTGQLRPAPARTAKKGVLAGRSPSLPPPTHSLPVSPRNSSPNASSTSQEHHDLARDLALTSTPSHSSPPPTPKPHVSIMSTKFLFTCKLACALPRRTGH